MNQFSAPSPSEVQPEFSQASVGPPVMFDIETMPNMNESKLPEFDRDSVKTGNITDPEKKKAKIDAAEAEFFHQWREKAALSAVDGRVLAIGYCRCGPELALSASFADTPDQEAKLIEDFWSLVRKCIKTGRKLIGVNISGFDLPFLCRRSWILEIDVPPILDRGRYWHPVFVDLCDRWLAGDRFGSTPANFTELARAFGTAGKVGGMTGKQFCQVYFENREQAIEYLKGDLLQPAEWARRMGVYV